MPKVQFFFSEHYNDALEKTEDFVLAQTGSVSQVEHFLVFRIQRGHQLKEYFPALTI